MTIHWGWYWIKNYMINQIKLFIYLKWNWYTRYTKWKIQKNENKNNTNQDRELTCADSSQHTISLPSTPFAVRSVQNASSQHNQFQRKTNMTVIGNRHLHQSLIIATQRFKTRLKFFFDLVTENWLKPVIQKLLVHTFLGISAWICTASSHHCHIIVVNVQRYAVTIIAVITSVSIPPISFVKLTNVIRME